MGVALIRIYYSSLMIPITRVTITTEHHVTFLRRTDSHLIIILRPINSFPPHYVETA